MTYYEAKRLAKERQQAQARVRKEREELRSFQQHEDSRSLGDDVKAYYFRHGYI